MEQNCAMMSFQPAQVHNVDYMALLSRSMAFQSITYPTYVMNTRLAIIDRLRIGNLSQAVGEGCKLLPLSAYVIWHVDAETVLVRTAVRK